MANFACSNVEGVLYLNEDMRQTCDTPEYRRRALGKVSPAEQLPVHTRHHPTSTVGPAPGSPPHRPV